MGASRFDFPSCSSIAEHPVDNRKTQEYYWMQRRSRGSAWASSNWWFWFTAAREVWVNPSCVLTRTSIRPMARILSPSQPPPTSGTTTRPCAGPKPTERLSCGVSLKPSEQRSSLWDGCHNSVTRRESDGEVVWVHCKGAVAADGNPPESALSRDAATSAVMIPGSRGSLSYLVKPTGDGTSHAWSLAHGMWPN